MHEASRQRKKAACVLPLQHYINLLVAPYSGLLNTLSFELKPRTAAMLQICLNYMASNVGVGINVQKDPYTIRVFFYVN